MSCKLIFFTTVKVYEFFPERLEILFFRNNIFKLIIFALISCLLSYINWQLTAL